jgi:hypothetical protein
MNTTPQPVYYGKTPAPGPDKSHPSYQLARGYTLPLASGGRKRQISPQP